MAQNPEFIDTYSDDLLYLLDFRDSHLTHPGKKATPFLLYASLSRIFCAFMIGSIESMIEYWREKDSNNILDAYFMSGSNEQRINSLIQNFKNNGINVDENILRRYLAIKYVRNSLIHSSWNENQKAFIKEMGFPTDTRKLNETHLELMYEVNVEMMKYIAATEHKEFNEFKLFTKLPSVKRYFTRKELAGFLWNNLERIHQELANGSTLDSSLAEEAVYDWILYKKLTIDNKVNVNSLDDNIIILQTLVDNKRYSRVPIGYLNLDQISLTSSEANNGSEIIANLEKVLNIDSREIPSFIEAYKQGRECYAAMINTTVPALFKILSSEKENILGVDLKEEEKQIDKMFKLARLHYNYSEHYDHSQ